MDIHVPTRGDNESDRGPFLANARRRIEKGDRGEWGGSHFASLTENRRNRFSGRNRYTIEIGTRS